MESFLNMIQSVNIPESSEINSLNNNLNSSDTFVVMESLNELSERLLMMNGLIAERILPTNLGSNIIAILNNENFQQELELQLVACRCLYNYLEVNQDFIHNTLHSIPILCSKLDNIEYIDLTEQVLGTLEIMSQEIISHNSIIQNDGLSKCFLFFDFYTIHTQRQIMKIIKNTTENISITNFNKIKDIIGNLIDVLNNQDNQIVENAYISIARIIQSFKNQPEFLQELFDEKLDLLKQIVNVIANYKSNKISESSSLILLKSLNILVNTSIEITKNFITNNLIKDLIKNLNIENLMNLKETTIHVMILIGILLPINYTEPLYIREFRETDERRKINESRVHLYKEIANDYLKFVNEVWDFLLLSFQATMDLELRRKVFINIYKIITSEIDYEKINNFGKIAGILASVVNLYHSCIRVEQSVDEDDDDDEEEEEEDNDDDEDEDEDMEDDDEDSDVEKEDVSKLPQLMHLKSALQITHNILKKSPEFIPYFEKEGIISDTLQILLQVKEKKLDYEPRSNYDFLSSREIYSNILKYATQIEELYLSTKVENNIPEHLKILEEFKLIKKNRINKLQWVDIWNNLKFAINGASSGVQISSFELLNAGLIETLLNLFEEDICQKTFKEVFFQNDAEDARFLISKLQEALTRSESFEIISTNQQENQASMANQVKLKLFNEDNNENLELILSVHAIATFKTVYEFLKNRFKFDEMNIEFLMNGEVIPNETTIYGAIYKSLQEKTEKSVDSRTIFSNVHEVSFRKVFRDVKVTDMSVTNNTPEVLGRFVSDILKLLKILFKMNTKLPAKEFNNFKLSHKLRRQLEEILVVASGLLPSWSIYSTKNFPFLYPMETRIFFLQSTSYGYSRLIHSWQLRSGNEGELGRPTRHKVRISRKMMLQSAMKVLELYGTTPGILEIEYFDEVGSGLGPTLEFYSTVSKEFCKKKLKLWRPDETQDEYIYNLQGLFPMVLSKQQITSENGKKILYFFSSLGKFIARALLDSRLIDFNFNPIFLELIQMINLGTSHKLIIKKIANLENLALVDIKLANSFEKLIEYRNQGKSIDELGLSYIIPGCESYSLGKNKVTNDNLDEYIQKVIEVSLFHGILPQCKAFIDGFSKVFPFGNLSIFSPSELSILFGSLEEDFSYNVISNCIVADHGYSKESQVIKYLIEVLSEFKKEEVREFMMFLTGSPRKPMGNFKITIVKKDNVNSLPSAMTCHNYLKLPNYNSKEILKEKLLIAIKEGAGAFLLS
ncbi:unnamed protein product [Candida verbasci]|uniref:HECT-type E3 ubiquitin transferase n=1 Tax=Candida verbasci TaxID=1227364 RepID=A0A9W4TU60_9ASCO|nr:unnamed protein product [Candida verbasci]